MSNLKDLAIVVSVCVLGVALFVLFIVAVFMFYGAIFGAIGAGIYLTFKTIVGLF